MHVFAAIKTNNSHLKIVVSMKVDVQYMPSPGFQLHRGDGISKGADRLANATCRLKRWWI